MDLSSNQVNLQDILSWVTSNNFKINLTNEKICFILSIFTLQNTSDSELTEEILIDIYRQVIYFRREVYLEQLASSESELSASASSTSVTSVNSADVDESGVGPDSVASSEAIASLPEGIPTSTNLEGTSHAVSFARSSNSTVVIESKSADADTSLDASLSLDAGLDAEGKVVEADHGAGEDLREDTAVAVEEVGNKESVSKGKGKQAKSTKQANSVHSSAKSAAKSSVKSAEFVGDEVGDEGMDLDADGESGQELVKELTDAQVASRANKLINDLVTTKLLNRFSLDWVDEESSLNDTGAIYRLSPLAMGIAENYFRQKEFSQVALSVQLLMVAKELSEVSNALTQVNNHHDWKSQIFAPLRYTVAEIINLIDYRQRELDEEQQQIKQQIADLLSKNWSDAIEQSKELLKSTSDTLNELQHTLSSAGDKLQSQLLQIYQAVNLHQEALNCIRLLQEQPELRDTIFRDNQELLNLVDSLREKLRQQSLIGTRGWQEGIFASFGFAGDGGEGARIAEGARFEEGARVGETDYSLNHPEDSDADYLEDSLEYSSEYDLEDSAAEYLDADEATYVDVAEDVDGEQEAKNLSSETHATEVNVSTDNSVVTVTTAVDNSSTSAASNQPLDFQAQAEMELLQDTLAHINDLIAYLQTRLDRIIAWGQQSIDLWIGFDRHIHKFIRTTIDLDKNRVFSTRLRRSVTEFLDAPFFLTTTFNERIMEMRSETQQLAEAETYGEIPTAIEYESFDNIQEQVSMALRLILDPFKQNNEPLDIAFVLEQVLRDNPIAMHFDMAKIFVEQAMRLGISQAELAGVQATWKQVNAMQAQVQANVIDNYNLKS